MSIVEIKNLSKSYKVSNEIEQTVFENLNLSINESGIVAVVGESGGGKSTLMNIIGGMDTDYEGEVIVDEQDLNNCNLDDFRKNKLGFIFQSFNLIPNLSVIENIEIAMDLTGKTKKEKRSIASAILTKVGLKEHIEKKPSQLSGGQKQRVAIARSLVNNPHIILADEPTGSLDKKNSEDVMNLLKDIASEGKLIIIVTHSEKIAKECDRMIRIDEGMIIEDSGPPKLSSPFQNKNKVSKNLSFFGALKHSLKNVIRNKKRNLLVSIGGSIGIFSVVLILGLSSGIKAYLYNELVGKTDTLNITATKGTSFGPGATNINQTKFQFSENEINKLTSIEGVSNYSTNSTIQGNSSISLGDKSLPLMMVSSDLTQVSTISKGRLPRENEILLTEKTASDLLEDGSKTDGLIGKDVEFSLAGDVPMIKNMRISGIASPSSALLTSIPIVFVSDIGMRGVFEANDSIYQPTAVILRAKNEKKADTISQEIKNLGYSGSSMDTAINQINDYISIATLILAGIASISLMVSAIMILVVMYISVVERTKEIGVLRAIGARKKDIKLMFIGESGIIGLISGLIGVGLAFGISIFTNVMVKKMLGLNIIDISLSYILIGLLLSVVVSVLAGYHPAAKAAKLDPIDSIRYE